MCARNNHSYTHLILALGIVRKPTVWRLLLHNTPAHMTWLGDQVMQDELIYQLRAARPPVSPKSPSKLTGVFPTRLSLVDIQVLIGGAIVPAPAVLASTRSSISARLKLVQEHSSPVATLISDPRHKNDPF